VRPSRAALLYWLPILIWMAVIIGLSSQSTLPKRNDPITGDPIPSMYPVAKAWHAFEYSVLSLLLYRAFRSREAGIGLTPLRAAFAAAAVCFAFGGLDEFRQSFGPRREASMYDVMLDGTAGTIAAFGWNLLRALIAPRRIPPSPA
jgi:VanZ family protein